MRTGPRPLKRLGQHFLWDRNIASRIVASVDLLPGDHVLEIGPGRGVLTEFILESRAGRIVAVEKDRHLVRMLRERFQEDDRLSVVEDDILNVDIHSLATEKRIRIVGNLPYYITTPILFLALENRTWISDLTVTVQAEVGERILSGPGSKIYGVPSVLFQAFGRVQKLFSIPKTAFSPVPSVESVVLRFDWTEKPVYDIQDIPFFKRLVRTVFQRRRKMIRNTLPLLIQDSMQLKALSIDLSRRPEEFSVFEFVELSNALRNA